MKSSAFSRLERQHAAELSTVHALVLLPKLLEAIDTPISLSICLRLKYEVKGYPEVHPFMYDLLHDGINRYKHDSQALALVNKAVFIDQGVDTKEVAFNGFLESERLNKLSNMRIGQLTNITTNVGCTQNQVILNNARDYLWSVLGEASVDFQLKFTSGSTATVRGREEKLLVNKVTHRPSITPTALRHFYTAIWGDPAAYAYAAHHRLIDDDSRLVLDNFDIITNEIVEFVPKNWKTDRMIKLQATLNGSLQRNAGDALKRAHDRATGWPMANIPDRHKEIVTRGHFHGYDISTIDIKSASDRICTELVRYLLPASWYTLLNDIRHRQWTLEDKELLQKHPEFANKQTWLEGFSAMGNGFTFELETLVFRAICVGVLKHLGLRTNAVSVFGDDIIIPTRAATTLVDVLSFLGFETNHEKTFINSPFLESCGCDVYYHIDCRPTYLKDFDKGIRGLYEMCNRIRSISDFLPTKASAIYRIWVTIIRKIRDCDPQLLCSGPAGFGDSVIICSRSDSKKLGFGNFPRTKDYSMSMSTVHKKTKAVEWLFSHESSVHNSTMLELAYMCLGGAAKGQEVALDRFTSKVLKTEVLGWDTYDWL